MSRMPDFVRAFLCGPVIWQLIVLAPVFFIAPLLLAALVAYIHGTAPGGWDGFWWQH